MKWTLLYDLYSCDDATDVSGLLTFVWGVAAFVVPAFETLILADAMPAFDRKPDDALLPISLNYATINNGTFYADSTTTASLTSLSPTYASTTVNTTTLTTTTPSWGGRAYGHEAVMYMLCSFLGVAVLSQLAMFAHVIRKIDLYEKKEDVKLPESEGREKVTQPLLDR